MTISEVYDEVTKTYEDLVGAYMQQPTDASTNAKKAVWCYLKDKIRNKNWAHPHCVKILKKEVKEVINDFSKNPTELNSVQLEELKKCFGLLCRINGVREAPLEDVLIQSETTEEDAVHWIHNFAEDMARRIWIPVEYTLPSANWTPASVTAWPTYGYTIPTTLTTTGG